VVVLVERPVVCRVGHGVGKPVVVLSVAEVVVELELGSVIVTVAVVVELVRVTAVVVELDGGTAVVVEIDGVIVVVVELEMNVVLTSTQVPVTTLV